ncbi:MAG: peroxide stress protein YaaA [Prolixibacteraceae bacterium]|nr:peroxide stress protein YaaA [Prolixibacteraceae bacterium]
MLAILSPAKDMKAEHRVNHTGLDYTLPEYVSVSEKLVGVLKKMKPDELARLMNVNPKLALLNYGRFQNWNPCHTPENSSPAILSFTGEAYRGLNANDFNTEAFVHSQKVLRILSGLYGILRPLDLIQAYRLEMGTKRAFTGKKNLYEIWTGQITKSLEETIKHSLGERCLINLASNEYSKAVDFQKINCQVIAPQFYEERGEERKMVTVYAKRARGLMARFIIKNQIEKAADLKAFDEEGYYYDSKNSSNDVFYFIRLGK